MVEGQKGTMFVEVETKEGYKLSKEHGFIVKEEDGKVLAFDFVRNPEYGNLLLFGNQIFFLKYWDKEDLQKALTMTQAALSEELARHDG